MNFKPTLIAFDRRCLLDNATHDRLSSSKGRIYGLEKEL